MALERVPSASAVAQALLLRRALEEEALPALAAAVVSSAVAAQIPQASQYSGSLFLQPLIRFLTLIFGRQESSRTRCKTNEFKHTA